MTEVRKPGSHSKLASVLLFSNLKNSVSNQRFTTDFLKILPVTPSNLIFCLGMPKALSVGTVK